VIGLETYRVKVQNFEKTLGVDQFKLKDDKYGLYYPIAANYALQSAKWPDYQVRDLLRNQRSQTGARQNGIDGLTHWNTAHPIDFYDASKGTYSNDFRGGFTVDGVSSGGALNGPNPFNTLWQAFSNRKAPNGEALGIEPDLTMTPSQLKATILTILQAQFFAPAAMGNLTGQVGALDNPLKGWTDILVNKDIQGDATTWYMFFVGGPIKPLSWILREAPDFVARIRPDDPVVFDTHTYLFGSMSRGTPAWSFPWLSAISGP